MKDTIDPNKLLMPKATAVWLIDNTVLTFDQIADFTGLHEIEIQALADEDVGRGIVGRDPVTHGEVTREELERCQGDPAARLKISRSELPPPRLRAKGPKYTPVSKRGDKPDAVAWILKNHPEITDAQICKLIGTTKPTIASVRDRSHPNASNVKPRHPAELGLCTYQELDAASRKGLKAQGKDPDEIKAQRQRELERQQEQAAAAAKESSGNDFSGFDFSNFLKRSSTGSSGEN